MEKKWIVAPAAPPEFQKKFPETPEVVLRLLYSRGLDTREKIDEFLNPDYSQDIHDPFLFRDMKKAVEKIHSAIEKEELIVIHGDYDADGVCASAILRETLKFLDAKRVDVFLPDRELDGYGLNRDTVELLASAGAKLLITCDCGISNKPEIERAKELGVSVIITDHHSVPSELPPADAVIHPKVPGEIYPDKGLSGGGVAFKLAQALLRPDAKNQKTMSRDQSITENFEKWLLDLVAISSVADMVPLLGESRVLSKYGLIVLNKTKRLGLRQLIKIGGMAKNSRPNLTAHNISFQIAPRLNAAGRVQHANTALQLLLAENPAEAAELARELNANNQERQKITGKMVAEAEEIIKRENQSEAPVIFVLKDNWPIGLVGLIASKLCDKFYRPVIVMTRKEKKIHGSGRSFNEIDIIEKLEKLKKYFEKFGGHPQACGFTLKNGDRKSGGLADFKKDLTDLVRKERDEKKPAPALEVDAELKIGDVDWELYDLLQKFEPFGEANPEPRFLARGLTVSTVEAVGADGRHLKLAAGEPGSGQRKFIGFGFNDENKTGANWGEILKPGDKTDVVFEVSAQEWNGERELQLKIIDLKKV